MCADVRRRYPVGTFGLATLDEHVLLLLLAIDWTMFRRSAPQPPTQRVNVEQLSRNELLAHVEELRNYQEVVTRERDRLLRENADYVNNSVSATFDSSSFLRETLLSRESELQQKKTELKHLKAERDELIEDVAMIKEAKRLSDRSCREVCKAQTPACACIDVDTHCQILAYSTPQRSTVAVWSITTVQLSVGCSSVSIRAISSCALVHDVRHPNNDENI